MTPKKNRKLVATAFIKADLRQLAALGVNTDTELEAHAGGLVKSALEDLLREQGVKGEVTVQVAAVT